MRTHSICFNFKPHFLLALLCVSVSMDAEAQMRQGTPNQSSRQQFQQSWQNRPTVSPYLSLVNNNGGNGSSLNYYNIVRPRQQAQRAVGRINSELNSIANQVQTAQTSGAVQANGTAPVSDAAPVSSGRMMPTGHPTAFGSVVDYYPGFAPKQR